MSELKEQIYKVRPLTLTFVSAHLWLSRGFKLLPCQPGTKRLVKSFGPVAGQVLLAEDVNLWFRDRGANLAVVAPDSVVILDFDELKAYESWAGGWPELAGSYTESTPRGGRHVFLSLAEPGGLALPGLIRGVEVKRFCMVHPSQIGGVRYEILEPGPIRTVSTETVKAALEPFFVPGQSNQPSPAAPGLGRLGASGGVSIGLRQNRGIIARVKAAWPIREYLEFFEPRLRLDGRGEWLSCLCPWHDDHTPSMRINIVTNTWRCFSCQARGDVINWHARRLQTDDMVLACRDLEQYNKGKMA
jgi:hypothetical protein